MDFLVVPAEARGIKSIKRLAHMLGVSPSALTEVAENAASYYKPFDKVKPNGKSRHIHNPTGELKRIQGLINRRLLTPVHASFPPYMVGAITGRNTKMNALKHLGSKAAMKFDLKDCYGSITDGTVHSMWYKFYDCSPAVATLLMKLTSMDSGIPQGASTSSTVANIVLFPILVDINESAESNGLVFTMYVDDGTISGAREPVYEAIPSIVERVINHGYRLASRKTKVVRRGRDTMSVTGLDFYSRPKPTKQYIEALRKQILTELKSADSVSDNAKSKIKYVNSLDPKVGKKLAVFLQRVTIKAH